MSEEKYKIRFRLVRDEEGYPPFTSENIWCARIGEGRYRVDNIPFFVKGISYADIISATEEPDGSISFHHLVSESGHSTLRVIFTDTDADTRPTRVRATELGEQVEKKGCGFQISPPPEILAIDVPPSVPLEGIVTLLRNGEKDDLWSYEEGTVAN